MQNTSSEIRVYVACLAAYNQGILHGAWIDASQGEQALWEGIQAVLKASPVEDAEEWAFHDYDGFEGIQISEYASLATIAKAASFIERYGELGGELAAYFGDIASAKIALENHYIGEYESVAEFAEEITEQSTTIPETLRFYIDYDKMAWDMKINDLIVIEISRSQQHLFWSF